MNQPNPYAIIRPPIVRPAGQVSATSGISTTSVVVTVVVLAGLAWWLLTPTTKQQEPRHLQRSPHVPRGGSPANPYGFTDEEYDLPDQEFERLLETRMARRKRMTSSDYRNMMSWARRNFPGAEVVRVEDGLEVNMQEPLPADAYDRLLDDNTPLRWGFSMKDAEQRGFFYERA